MIRVVYDDVTAGADVTDAFEGMASVMGEHGRWDHTRSDQRGRLRWITLRPPHHRRFWAHWLGYHKPEDVGPLIQKWARRLRGKRQGNGFVYVMWYQDKDFFRVSFHHVPYIHPEILDCSLFKLKPPVKGWPQRIS